MSIDQGLMLLAAVCLGLAIRPHLMNFRRKAWTVAGLGSGFGLLLASRFAVSATEGAAKVFAFSLTTTAAIIALCIATMWFAERRRPT